MHETIAQGAGWTGHAPIGRGVVALALLAALSSAAQI